MSPKYVSFAPAAGSAAVLSPTYDVCSPIAEFHQMLHLYLLYSLCVSLP